VFLQIRLSYCCNRQHYCLVYLHVQRGRQNIPKRVATKTTRFLISPYFLLKYKSDRIRRFSRWRRKFFGIKTRACVLHQATRHHGILVYKMIRITVVVKSGRTEGVLFERGHDGTGRHSMAQDGTGRNSMAHDGTGKNRRTRNVKRRK
jgi:hypothetical protein